MTILSFTINVSFFKKKFQATQILFMNTVDFVTFSGSVKGCGSKNRNIPSKFIRSVSTQKVNFSPRRVFFKKATCPESWILILESVICCIVPRSYWIASMSWTPDSLFLACMLKRGSLILMTCLGELLTLVTFGCSVEFGPAEFVPLHPLVTYRWVKAKRSGGCFFF